MNNENITQKLALLPEGLAESNLQSWNKIVKFFGSTEVVMGEYFPQLFGIYELVVIFSISEQAKLFRADESVYDLIISTTERHGLKSGEPLVRVFYRGGLMAQYEINGPVTNDKNLNVHERKSCSLEDDVMTNLQPMLNRLLNETRGKKNA